MLILKEIDERRKKQDGGNGSSNISEGTWRHIAQSRRQGVYDAEDRVADQRRKARIWRKKFGSIPPDYGEEIDEEWGRKVFDKRDSKTN